MLKNQRKGLISESETCWTEACINCLVKITPAISFSSIALGVLGLSYLVFETITSGNAWSLFASIPFAIFAWICAVGMVYAAPIEAVNIIEMFIRGGSRHACRRTHNGTYFADPW